MAHMRKIIAAVGGIIAILTALYTSPSLRDFTRSPESKINNAAPISEKLRLAKTAIVETASRTQWKEIEEELEARLKIRALHCAKGYSPAFYVSTESAKKFLTDMNCFADIDNDIAYWLGLRRVGILLTKPALKPLPTSAPSFIVTDAAIQNVTFAGNAGIAMMETNQELQIIDIDSQKPLLRELKGSAVVGSLTANGRLFISGDTNRLKIRESESGAVVAELNGIRPQAFHWLDEVSALYNKIGSEKTFLLDFSTGKETLAQAINKQVLRVVRMPQTTNQFAAFTPQGITKIELIRTPTGLEAKLLDEKHDTVPSTESQASGVTSDGFHFFHAGRQVTIVSLNTLTTQTIPLQSFHTRFAMATPDPDLIVLVGSGASSKESANYLLYSISKQSTKPLDRPRLSAQRYLYANTLKRQAAIIDNKIALLDMLQAPQADGVSSAATGPRSPSPSASKDEHVTKTGASESEVKKKPDTVKQPVDAASTPAPAASQTEAATSTNNPTPASALDLKPPPASKTSQHEAQQSLPARQPPGSPLNT